MAVNFQGASDNTVVKCTKRIIEPEDGSVKGKGINHREGCIRSRRVSKKVGRLWWRFQQNQ